MAAIDDVITWASTLPAWLGDAVRRLLLAGEQPLSPQDYREILTLAKANLGLASCPDDLAPIPPAHGVFSGVPAAKAPVMLLSIDDVRNVNIIKSGQSQPFAESGITVVYGSNGSGKSGYARILKSACQARDKDEAILPDVFASTPAGPPTATLKVKRGAAIPSDITWTQGIDPDPILTNITVFDGRCARVITDARNEISYLPYGAEVFQKTADVILRIRGDLQGEISPPVPVQDSAITPGTQSSNFLESLSATTSDEAIQQASAWTPQDDLQLVAKEDLARTSDSTRATQETERLGKIKGRVNNTITAVSGLLTACAPITNEEISNALAELNAARQAHALAVAERQTPEPLPGVATTDQWEILYRAAKRYSEEVAYPEEPFPKTADAVCVLCQQPLSEGAIARFARFKRFMEDATSAALAEKRIALSSLRANAEALTPLSGAPLDSICDEIERWDANAAAALRTFHTGLSARRTATLKLLIEGEEPQKAVSLAPWPVSPEEPLQAVVQTLTQRISEITNAAKPEEYEKLTAGLNELKSRKAISLRKGNIEEFVSKARRNARLGEAVSILRTQEITRQGTTVIRKNLTPELVNAFKAELKALGATRVPVSIKPSGVTGETAHEMLLEGAQAQGRAHTSQILSEGETRVIAIAGFLAELLVADHNNAIIFDDPVSSLDHVFTRKTAARLAKEGLKRQVIIFTHNIAFLMELEDACEELAKAGTPTPLTIHTLRRGGRSAGITTDGAPWHAMKVKQRAQYLEERLHQIKHLYEENMPEYNKEASHLYGLLREAWESCVEDELFYGVVCRYRNSVQTLKLINVAIEDPDVHHLDLNMSKTSTWMTGHDKSKALHEDRPAPDELLADINELRAFSKKLASRRAETEKRRKAQLAPQPL
jgi:hypothetical protein